MLSERNLNTWFCMIYRVFRFEQLQASAAITADVSGKRPKNARACFTSGIIIIIIIISISITIF